jgi:hypothetical protein
MHLSAPRPRWCDSWPLECEMSPSHNVRATSASLPNITEHSRSWWKELGASGSLWENYKFYTTGSLDMDGDCQVQMIRLRTKQLFCNMAGKFSY